MQNVISVFNKETTQWETASYQYHVQYFYLQYKFGHNCDA